MLRGSRAFLNLNVPWEDVWPAVTECGLSFCAKAYLSEANNGVLNETVLGSWSIRHPRSWSVADVSQGGGLTPPYWEDAPDRARLWDQYHPTFDITGDRLRRSDLEVSIPPNVSLPSRTEPPSISTRN